MYEMKTNLVLGNTEANSGINFHVCSKGEEIFKSW